MNNAGIYPEQIINYNKLPKFIAQLYLNASQKRPFFRNIEPFENTRHKPFTGKELAK